MNKYILSTILLSGMVYGQSDFSAPRVLDTASENKLLNEQAGGLAMKKNIFGDVKKMHKISTAQDKKAGKTVILIEEFSKPSLSAEDAAVKKKKDSRDINKKGLYWIDNN